MNWAGTTISTYGLPLSGRRVRVKWLDNDETLYWDYDEDLYNDLT